MKKMIDYIPEIVNLDKYDEYEDIWNSVYKDRMVKVNEDRASHSANAVVYSEVLKDYIKNKG